LAVIVGQGFAKLKGTMMAVMSISRFEQFFRRVAGLDVDKEDLRRYSDFVNQKIYDLLLIAQARAKANRRDVMLPMDLPITKGLQECIHDFEDLNEEIELLDILDQLTKFPLLDLEYSDDLEARLPAVAGGLSVALARSFKILEPQVKNPHAELWERAFKIFDLIL
jgi:hypothetical protein